MQKKLLKRGWKESRMREKRFRYIRRSLYRRTDKMILIQTGEAYEDWSKNQTNSKRKENKC